MKYLEFRSLIPASLLCLMALAPAGALASDGNSSGGGGDSVAGQLLDDYENSGLRPVEIEKLSVYPALYDYLYRIAGKVPGVARGLSAGLKSKPWFFDSKDIIGSGDPQSVVATPDKQRVAYQNELHVRLSDKLLQPDKKALLLETIKHELVRNYAINNEVKDEYRIRELKRTLDLNLSGHELLSALNKLGIRKNYLSSNEEAKLGVTIWTAFRAEYARHCMSPEDPRAKKVISETQWLYEVAFFHSNSELFVKIVEDDKMEIRAGFKAGQCHNKGFHAEYMREWVYPFFPLRLPAPQKEEAKIKVAPSVGESRTEPFSAKSAQ